MEIIYTDGMITINETMVVVLASFLLLVFVLNRLMFRPLLSTIQERENYLNGLAEEIKKAGEEASELEQALRDQEYRMKMEALKIKKTFQQAGDAGAEEIRNRSQEEIMEIRKKANQDINAQIEAARQGFRREAQDLSAEIMAMLLNRQISH